MATKEAIDYGALADALRQVANELSKMNGSAPARSENDEAQTYSSQITETVTGKKSKGPAKGAEKSGDTYSEKYLKSLPIKELRTLGSQNGVDSKLKGDIIDALAGQPVGKSQDSDEDDDDETDESAENYTRSDLEEMSTKSLRGIAREYDDYEKGMARDAMISLVLGGSEDSDDEDEDDDFEDEDDADDEDSEDEDSDEDDSDEDEEETTVTREDLKAMTSKSLKDLHKEYGFTLPKTEGLSKQKAHNALVDSVLEQATDDDDEDDDE